MNTIEPYKQAHEYSLEQFVSHCRISYRSIHNNPRYVNAVVALADQLDDCRDARSRRDVEAANLEQRLGEAMAFLVEGTRFPMLTGERADWLIRVRNWLGPERATSAADASTNSPEVKCDLRARLAEAEAKLKEIDTKAGGFISTDPRANNPAEWPTREEADRVLDRLNSSDPDFDACAAAAALIYKLVSQVQGPPGFATWQDAAVDERMRRIALAARLAEAERELAEALRLLSVMPGHGLSAFESDDWWNARATWLAARRS